MAYIKLPPQFYNNPLMAYANFEDGSHVNLIRLIKPYANGIAYGVDETTNNPFCSNGVFKNLGQATAKFDLMVRNHSHASRLIKLEWLK